MDESNFEKEIVDLIALGTEGSYWDFKREWHDNNVDLLHDIICMANNLENRDGYIIIGVDDETKTICGVPETNRKNQQNLIDFIKGKKFAGDIRPNVYVKNLILMSKLVDVIIIKNSTNTPYYLKEHSEKERGKQILAGSVYTRIGDTNTPKDSTADIDKTEYLWRKRFGIELSPLEKSIFLLHNSRNWHPIGTDGQHSSNRYAGQYYHKQFPEFNLKYTECEERFAEGKINTIERDIYWMNKLPRPLHNAYIYSLDIKYHSTVMYSTLAIFADGYRFNRVLWKSAILFKNMSNEYISYCYVEKDNIDFALDNWLSNSHDTIPQIEEYPIINSLEPWISQPEYKAYNPYSVVPVFENAQEHKAFITFVKDNQSLFFNTIGDYSFNKSPYKKSHAQIDAPDYIEYLCKSGETLVHWLDEWKKRD